MFALTKQEKWVVIAFLFIVIGASTVKYLVKRFPVFENLINLMDSDQIYYKVDVNKISEFHLSQIPFVGEKTAQKIIEYRRDHKVIRNLNEILKIPSINRKNFNNFSKFLKVDLPQ